MQIMQELLSAHGGSFAQHEATLQNCWPHPTLTWGDPTLPSALSGFTSEFEMESGGSHLLWSSGNSGVRGLTLRVCPSTNS